MAALGSVNAQGGDGVNGNEKHCTPGQVGHPIARDKELRKRKDEDGEMEEECRVCQVGEYLPGEARPFCVVIGEKPKAGVQPAALLTGVKHGDIKGREP